jgi:CDGSH-type Zn-finger protein/uncharacterized Fe-S cluster protein YjdI
VFVNDVAAESPLLQREVLINALYEAAELEHNLMCTYLYAAASLKGGAAEGLSAPEAAAVARWKQALLAVAIEEMGHLAAVWNITAALGGSPRFGRTNFPLDPGYLPASVAVKLAPFNAETLQHFVFLERPHGSAEPDGAGFAYEHVYRRGGGARLTPMGIDYDTVGTFYAALGEGLKAFVARYGEPATFDGDPALQLSPDEVSLGGARPVRCLKTALAAFCAIVEQGEGAPQDSQNSHYQKFIGIRTELRELNTANPQFAPAFAAATNPVLRRPPRPEGRVWLETPAAVATVDLANACYGLMLRLLAYAYALRSPSAEKALIVDLAIGLMRAVMPLAERAARLPAGPSNPQCNAGMSFTTLRDTAALPAGPAARRLFLERFGQLAAAATLLATDGEPRARAAAELLTALERRAVRSLDPNPVAASEVLAAPAPRAAASAAAPAPALSGDTERIAGTALDLIYEGKRCIHSRFCVTLAPQVFLANVKGPWIHPDAMPAERLVDIAHACPSGAIRYQRRDGQPEEGVPPVNLAGLREGGPYAFRGALVIDGVPGPFRATLCRCGASKNKPYCDGSHHAVGFSASGEPDSGKTDMLPARDGTLAIDPQTNGPLSVRGNLEITSGTGRVVARLTTAVLCRCGGSAAKPFCDGTHARIGFRSV